MIENTFDHQTIGRLLQGFQERIDRLEATDGLTMVHPITGSKEFVGTVITTPSGEPVFVASQDEGLEFSALPGEPNFSLAPPTYEVDAALETRAGTENWWPLLSID